MPDPERAELLQTRHLSKWFGATRALRDVSVGVEAGEIHALVGANGSGKSTLVKILCGVYSADLGQIVRSSDGVVIAAVHQNLGLFGEGTVRENICSSVSGRILAPARELALVRRLCGQIGLTASAEAKVQQLPVDQQALVAVARALALIDAADGGVLIVDEVTSILRGRAAEQFAEVLGRLRDRGIGIVLVSHDLDEVLGVADRVTVIVDGAVRATVTSESVDKDRLIHLMTGVAGDLGAGGERARSAGGEIVLRTDGLGGDLLHDFDVALRAGEVVGVIGVPGSGYDELPYLVAGARPAGSRGRVLLNGNRVSSPESFARHGGRLIPADRMRSALATSGSVLENFMLDHRGGAGRWGMRSARRERRAVAAAVERYGIKCASISEPITTLSGGNQQKLIMARCLEAAPSLLVLHEPTQGVDVKARAELLASMRRAVRHNGLSVLYVCGDIDELWDNVHRVVAVRRGRKVGEVDVDGASKDGLQKLLY